MKTENIGNAQTPYTQYQNTVKQGKEEDKGAAALLRNPIDTYTPSKSILEAAAKPADVEKLWADTNHAASAIRKLVMTMIGREDASGQAFWAVRAQGGMKRGADIDMKQLQEKLDELKSGNKLTEAERAEAQDMISEDGFFGVKQTSERLMSFAKALVGDNASSEKIENMRNAVQKGFDEVARLFGGFDRLPDVTKDTYNATMSAFDDWMNGGAASTDTE